MLFAIFFILIMIATIVFLILFMIYGFRQAFKIFKNPEKYRKYSNQNTQAYWTNQQQQQTNGPEIYIDYSSAYEAQTLFSYNEWQNYKKLREVAEIKKYIVCPKVRLLDIIRPRSGHEKYKTLLYKIQAKHVDFVICDQYMNIKAIIELDDSSHDTQKGRERDQFVDTVLKSVGYKVIHTRYINHDILDLV